MIILDVLLLDQNLDVFGVLDVIQVADLGGGCAQTQEGVVEVLLGEFLEHLTLVALLALGFVDVVVQSKYYYKYVTLGDPTYPKTHEQSTTAPLYPHDQSTGTSSSYSTSSLNYPSKSHSR